MYKKFYKKSVSVIALLGVLTSFSVIPVSAAPFPTQGINLCDSSDITPYTMYLKYGEITYQRLNSSTMRVLITTAANTNVSSLYHDVVIYKNGQLAFSGRKTGSKDTSLTTPIDIPASSGDFFSTYVTHYVSHNGYTEHGDTHKDKTF